MVVLSGALALLLYVFVVLRPPLFVLDQENTAAPEDILRVRPGQTLTQGFAVARPSVTHIALRLRGGERAAEARLVFSVVSDGNVVRTLAGTIADFASELPERPPGIAVTTPRWLVFPVNIRAPQLRGNLSFTLQYDRRNPLPLLLSYQHDGAKYRLGTLTVNAAARQGDVAFRTYADGSLSERVFERFAVQPRASFIAFGLLLTGALVLCVDLLQRWRGGRALLPTPPLLFFTVLALAYTFPLYTDMTHWGMWDWPETTSYYQAARHSLAALQFPLWNPYLGGGHPLWAAPQPYWPSLAFLLTLAFGDILGTKIAVTVYLLLGLWGMHFLSRAVGIRSTAATIPPVVFLFGGFLVSHLAPGQLLWLTVAYVPWVLAFFLESLRRPWFVVPSALTLLLIFLEGRLHLVVFTGIVLAVVSLGLAVRKGHATIVFRRDIMFALVFFLVGAVKIVPTLEFLGEIEGSLPQTNGTPWFYLGEVLLTRTADLEYTRPWTTLPWHEHAAYVGLGALLLAVIGGAATLAQRRGVGVTLLVLAGIFTIIATSSVEQGDLFTRLPFAAYLRKPGRAIVMVVMTIALLAGYGADTVVSRLRRGRVGEALALLAALLLFADDRAVASPVFAQLYTVPTLTFDVQGQPFFQSETNAGNAYHIVRAGYGAKAYFPPYLKLFHPTAEVFGIEEGAYRGEAYTAGGSDVTLETFSPNILRIRVRSMDSERDTLFINQKFSRGWQSKGRTVTSDAGRIAVPLTSSDAGTVIAVRYLPTSVILGGSVSGAAVAVLLFLWVSRRRRGNGNADVLQPAASRDTGTAGKPMSGR